jgi:hypothetical protein
MDRGRVMSEDERISILNWAGLDHPFIKLGDNRLHLQLDPTDATVPAAVWAIKQRIVDRENLASLEQEPILKDFLGLVLPGGSFKPHTDPNQGSLIHFRFNVFIQLPKKGGRTYYAGRLVDAREGHYVVSRSGIDFHWADKNEDTLDRITLSFGFLTKDLDRFQVI